VAERRFRSVCRSHRPDSVTFLHLRTHEGEGEGERADALLPQAIDLLLGSESRERQPTTGTGRGLMSLSE